MDLVHRVDFAVVRMADLLERRWTRGAGLNWFRVLWKEFIMGIEFSGTGRRECFFLLRSIFISALNILRVCLKVCTCCYNWFQKCI